MHNRRKAALEAVAAEKTSIVGGAIAVAVLAIAGLADVAVRVASLAREASLVPEDAVQAALADAARAARADEAPVALPAGIRFCSCSTRIVTARYRPGKSKTQRLFCGRSTRTATA